MRAMLFESVTSKYLSKLCEIRYSHSTKKILNKTNLFLSVFSNIFFLLKILMRP